MVLCVGVRKEDVQKLKMFLQKNDLFLEGYRYDKDDKVWFAVKEEFSFPHVVFEDRDLAAQERAPSWREAAKTILSDEEYLVGKFSYDQVGTIAIVEIVPELEEYEHALAALLLQHNKAVKTVLKKATGHEGELRTQKMIFLAGEDTRETVSHENGVRIVVNVETVYYSVRLGTERNRIMQLVKPGEEVLCMFSGAAPYPVVFSKNTEAKKIVGVELNEEGHAYGLKNLELNNVKNVELICGDVKEVVPKLKKFDRITMPLPHTGEEFLPVALDAIKNDGTIHYYCFVENEAFDEEQKRIEGVIKNRGKKIKKISYVVCGQHSPSRSRVCYDLVIE